MSPAVILDELFTVLELQAPVLLSKKYHEFIMLAQYRNSSML